MPRHRLVRSAVLVTLVASVAAGPPSHAVATRTPGMDYDDVLAAVAVPGFAGVWVEGDRLAVWLTRPSDAAARAARADLARLLGRPELGRMPVDARPARYSFRRLHAWHDALLGDVLALPGVVSADVDERANVVRFGATDTDVVRPLLSALLARHAVPADAVALSTDAPPRRHLRDVHRPLAGGLLINVAYGNCSLGFPAEYQGFRGFVTAAHCTKVTGKVDGSVFYQGSVLSTDPLAHVPVGVEVADPDPVMVGLNVYRASDAAFVAVPNPGDYLAGYIAKPPLGSFVWNGVDKFRIVSELAEPLGGETITHVGQRTGHTSGSVLSSCTTSVTSVIDVVGTPPLNLTCQFGAAYTSNSGDSGAPVFVVLPNGTDVALAGINWGSTSSSSMGGPGLFSPMKGLVADFGALSVCATGFTC